MKAVFTMWKNTRMIVLVAVCAAIYGGARVALKIAFPFSAPDITEVGVANLFPMVFGLLFGPAGAWGAAFGNLIGDIFGTLTWGSIFDFFRIFLLGYLPYAMWTTLKPIADGQREPAVWRSWVLYILIALISSAAGSVVVATLLSVLGVAPYAATVVPLALIPIFGNLIGGILFLAVNGLVKRRLGLIWWDMLDEQDIGKPLAGTIGAWLVTAGALVGAVGALISFGGSYILAGQAVSVIFTLLIIVGSILM